MIAFSHSQFSLPSLVLKFNLSVSRVGLYNAIRKNTLFYDNVFGHTLHHCQFVISKQTLLSNTINIAISRFKNKSIIEILTSSTKMQHHCGYYLLIGFTFM